VAELVEGGGWPQAGSLAATLRDGLPEGYFVVPDVTVRGQPLDAVVVGPQGLFLLLAKGWEGKIYPAQRGPWRGALPSGRDVQVRNPAGEARRAESAVRAFLRDEFPGLRPGIRPVLVLSQAGARLAPLAAECTVVNQERVAETIAAFPAPSEEGLADEDVREQVAVALRERQLTASQRAKDPFVFRSGGLLGSGKKVWTIRAAVRHMDRHPEDGIYHLRNGTLAQWLSGQGAEHLAGLAREVMRRQARDARVALETFLIGTGLVRRPRLSVRPKRMHLGYALPGEAREGRLRVRKGRGRGYLFGALHSSEPWLRVEPHSLSGKPLQAVVSAGTGGLPISQAPWPAEIVVESSASPQPIAIPVRVRVVGLPSPLNRSVVRPLAGALCAGLLGAALGWALGRWGAAVPGWAAALLPFAVSPAAFWAAVAGLLWAALGAARGLLQPAAWPVSYAAGRWLLRTLLWGAALAALAAEAHWSWERLGPGEGAGIPLPGLGAAMLGALALSAVPSTWSEVRSGRRRGAAAARPVGRWRFVRRPALVVALGVILILAVVVGVPLLGRAWQRIDADQVASQAQEWVQDRWSLLEAQVDGLIDRLTVQHYDRRAPLRPMATPAAEPAASPLP
jgi:hypothetical protein